MRAFRPREKTCKACRAQFVPMRPMQEVCGPMCARAYAKAKRVKRERREAALQRRESRAKLEEMKTIPQLMAEADKAFCAYIRARDEGKPCICCGRHSSGWTRGGDWDGGHYRSRGAASHLRYDERNCHAQLKQCNRRAFDVASYRANLIKRIGLAEVESLELDNRTHKWSKEELRSIRDTYRVKLKEIKKEAA